MGLLYPIKGDAPEDVDTGYDEFASELSPSWVVHVALVDEDGVENDEGIFGPMSPRDAWDLGNDLEERLGVGITVELLPTYAMRSADEVIAFLMPTDPPTVDS